MRPYHLPEKFLVASIVVRMAPCNRKQQGVWGRRSRKREERQRNGREVGKEREALHLDTKPKSSAPPLAPTHISENNPHLPREIRVS